MKKKRICLLLAVIVCLIIAVPVLAVTVWRSAGAAADEEMAEVTVWQIDGFEGGRGSRAQFLKTSAEKCFGNKKTYVTVVSLTAEAARENLGQGNVPEMISYPAGFYGLENHINEKNFAYKTWNYGSYCLLTTDEGADFSDVSAKNTVINAGKDNLTEVAALLCGVSGAQTAQPTSAYLQLIGGKYKYLLGTQRDVFRLRTRGVAFKAKAVTGFNDLYQNISVLTKDGKKYEVCRQFIDYLSACDSVGALGLFAENAKVEVDELKELASTKFEYILNYPCSREFIAELQTAAKNGDANKIKNLLK